MENVIWGTNATRDHISRMGDEEKFNTLVDRGYDPEMLGNANMDDVLSHDDYMWQDDVQDFDERILPMINAQTKNGIVIMCNGEECKPVNAEDLVGGDIDPDVYDVQILDDGAGLVWVGNGINGEKKYELRGIPEDIDLQMIMPEFEGEEFDLGDLTTYGDLDSAVQALPRLTNGLSEGCHKEALDEAVTHNKEELANELEEIKPLADEYGVSYFTSMPCTAFEGDPESVEAQFPEFFKVIKAFFREMGIASEEELADTDYLDELWDTNIDDRDFRTILKTCELMVAHNDGSQQIEKVYKGEYESPLNDDQIKADREQQDELAAEYGDEENESLNEARKYLAETKLAVEAIKDHVKSALGEDVNIKVWKNGESFSAHDNRESSAENRKKVVMAVYSIIPHKASGRYEGLVVDFHAPTTDFSAFESLMHKPGMKKPNPHGTILDSDHLFCSFPIETDKAAYAGMGDKNLESEVSRVCSYLDELFALWGFGGANESLTEASHLGACDSKLDKIKQDKAFKDQERKEDDAKKHIEYEKNRSPFDIRVKEGLSEDTVTDEDELNQSTEDLAKELADSYKSEFNGSAESEQMIYDDIVDHFEDPEYAELVIELLKNDFYEEEPEFEESLTEESDMDKLQDKLEDEGKSPDQIDKEITKKLIAKQDAMKESWTAEALHEKAKSYYKKLMDLDEGCELNEESLSDWGLRATSSKYQVPMNILKDKLLNR